MSEGEKVGSAYVDLTANVQPLQGALALGFGLLQGYIIKATAELDTAMRNIWTIMSDESEAGMKRYEDKIMKLARELPQTQSQLAEGLYQVVSANIEAKDSMYVLETSAIAASAGLTDTFTTVDAITTVLNSYTMQASEAGRVSDIMFKAVERGKMTFEQMAGSLGAVVPSAAMAGISFEEVSAALATITATGISADEAATALNRMILSIVQPSEDAFMAADSAGVQLNELALRQKGLVGVIKELETASGGSLTAMAEFIPEIRALKSVLSLSRNDGEDFARNLDIMTNSTGASAAAFEKQKDSIQNSLTLMKNAMNEFAIKAGESIIPVLTDVTNGLTGIFQFIADLPDETKKFALGVAGFAAAFGPIKTAVEGIIAIMTGPAGWVVAVVAVIAIIVTLIAKMEDWQGAALKTAQKQAEVIEDLIKGAEKAGAQAKELEAYVKTYQELSKETKLSAEEQQRLNDAVAGIGKIAPGVVTDWNEMGAAVKINIQAAKNQIAGLYATQKSYLNAAYSAANAQMLSMRAATEKAEKELAEKQKQFEAVQLRFNLDAIIDADKTNWNKRAGDIYKSEVKPLLTKAVSALTDAEIKALMEYLAGGAGQMATDIGKVFNGLKAQSAAFAGSVTGDAVAQMFQKITEGGNEGAKLLKDITDLSGSIASFYELKIEAENAKVRIDELTESLKAIGAPATPQKGSSLPNGWKLLTPNQSAQVQREPIRVASLDIATDFGGSVYGEILNSVMNSGEELTVTQGKLKEQTAGLSVVVERTGDVLNGLTWESIRLAESFGYAITEGGANLFKGIGTFFKEFAAGTIDGGGEIFDALFGLFRNYTEQYWQGVYQISKQGNIGFLEAWNLANEGIVNAVIEGGGKVGYALQSIGESLKKSEIEIVSKLGEGISGLGETLGGAAGQFAETLAKVGKFLGEIGLVITIIGSVIKLVIAIVDFFKGLKQREEQKAEEEKRAPLQISDISGAMRDTIVTALAPLNGLYSIGTYKDEIVSAIREVRDALTGGAEGAQAASAGIRQTFNINSVNITAANGETFQSVMRGLETEIRLATAAVGGVA